MLVAMFLVQVCVGIMVRFSPKGLARSLGKTSETILGSYFIDEDGIETVHNLLQYGDYNFKRDYDEICETPERVTRLVPFMHDKRLHKTIFSGEKLVKNWGLAHKLLGEGEEYTGAVLDVLPKSSDLFQRGFETFQILIENAVERGEQCENYQWLRQYLKIAGPDAANYLLELFAPRMTPRILTEFLLFANVQVYMPAELSDVELVERSVTMIVTGHRLNVDCHHRFCAAVPERVDGVATAVIASRLDTVLNEEPTDEIYIELLSLSFRFAQKQRSGPWWSIIAYLISICHGQKISKGVCKGTAGIYLGTVPSSCTNPGDIILVTDAYKREIEDNILARFPYNYWPMEYRPFEVRLAAWKHQMPISQWPIDRVSTLDAVWEGVLIMHSYPSNIVLQSKWIGDYLIHHVEWVMRLTVNNPDPTLRIILSLPYHMQAGRKCPIWQDIDLMEGWGEVINRLAFKSNSTTRKRAWKLLDISLLPAQFAPCEVFVHAKNVIIGGVERLPLWPAHQ